MERSRVLSIVEETWGRGTMFGDTEAEIEEEIKQDLPEQSSKIIEDTVTYQNPEQTCAREDSVEIDPYSLQYLQASLFATVLEDSLTELKILAECNNELRISKTMSEMTLRLALKYDVKQPEVVDELEGIDIHDLGAMTYKIKKLDADRFYAKDVIMSTYVDLSINRTFKALKGHVAKVINLENYRIVLAEDETKNKMLRREINKQLRQQRNHIKSAIYDCDVTIDGLKTQVEDCMLYDETRSRYIGNWQRARFEQNAQTIFEKESIPSESIEYYKQRCDHEQRIHSEIELLVNIAINETLEKVENWMDKYDKDMENIDLKIQIKKNDYQNALDHRTYLESTIEKHDQMMKDWVHFKDEREKARQYVEKMTKSALIVQAWWRGMLVRRQLGPYKVSKKKGGGKKK